jgi:hypothetical protein
MANLLFLILFHSLYSAKSLIVADVFYWKLHVQNWWQNWCWSGITAIEVWSNLLFWPNLQRFRLLVFLSIATRASGTHVSESLSCARIGETFKRQLLQIKIQQKHHHCLRNHACVSMHKDRIIVRILWINVEWAKFSSVWINNEYPGHELVIQGVQKVVKPFLWRGEIYIMAPAGGFRCWVLDQLNKLCGSCKAESHWCHTVRACQNPSFQRVLSDSLVKETVRTGIFTFENICILPHSRYSGSRFSPGPATPGPYPHQ